MKNELINFYIDTLIFEGHGGRPINGTCSVDCFVQNDLDFMFANQLQNASFFGYSTGGYVALKLAAYQPEKVESPLTGDIDKVPFMRFHTAATSLKYNYISNDLKLSRQVSFVVGGNTKS